jgi:hypothetical protein
MEGSLVMHECESERANQFQMEKMANYKRENQFQIGKNDKLWKHELLAVESQSGALGLVLGLCLL